MVKQNKWIWIVGVVLIAFMLYQYNSNVFVVSPGASVVYVNESICESKLLSVDEPLLNNLISMFCVVNSTNASSYFPGDTCASDEYSLVIKDNNTEIDFSIDYLITDCNSQLNNFVDLGEAEQTNSVIHTKGIKYLETLRYIKADSYLFCTAQGALVNINNNKYSMYKTQFTECVPKQTTHIVNQTTTPVYTNQTLLYNNTIYTNQTITQEVPAELTFTQKYSLWIIILLIIVIGGILYKKI